MPEILHIKDLKPGDKATVCGYRDSEGNYRRKLLAMGLTRGTEVTMIKRAPMGDPVEIKVRDFSLTLRKEEAEVVELKEAE